jgi:hypothetical protein
MPFRVQALACVMHLRIDSIRPPASQKLNSERASYGRDGAPRRPRDAAEASAQTAWPAAPRLAPLFLIRRLAQIHADPTPTDQRGLNDYSPLHMAVSERNLPALKLFFEAGADPYLRTREQSWRHYPNTFTICLLILQARPNPAQRVLRF